MIRHFLLHSSVSSDLFGAEVPPNSGHTFFVVSNDWFIPSVLATTFHHRKYFSKHLEYSFEISTLFTPFSYDNRILYHNYWF